MAEKYIMPCIVEDGVEDTLYTFALRHNYVPIMLRFYGEEYITKNKLCDKTTLAQHTTIDTGEEYVRLILLNANLESDLLGNFTSESNDRYVCFWGREPCNADNMSREEFMSWYKSTVQKLCSAFEKYNWCMQEIETGVCFEEFLQFLTNAFEFVSKEKIGKPISFDFGEFEGEVVVKTSPAEMVGTCNDFEDEANRLYFSHENDLDMLCAWVRDVPVWDEGLFRSQTNPTLRCMFWSMAYKAKRMLECVDLANSWLHALGLQEG